MEKMIQELCLLLMFLTGWEEESRQKPGEKIYRAWKGYLFETLNRLADEKLIVQFANTKSVTLTEKSRTVQDFLLIIDLAVNGVEIVRADDAEALDQQLDHGHAEQDRCPQPGVKEQVVAESEVFAAGKLYGIKKRVMQVMKDHARDERLCFIRDVGEARGDDGHRDRLAYP